MSDVLLGLGEIFFYSPYPNEPTPGFDTLSRDRSFSWPQQGRLNQEPAVQFTGPGADTRTIEGRLFPGMFGGLKTLDMLDAAGVKGEPLIFTRFYYLAGQGGQRAQYVGEIQGEYSITRVRQTHKHIGSTGVANMIDFTVELQAFGRDPQDGGGDFLYLMAGAGNSGMAESGGSGGR